MTPEQRAAQIRLLVLDVDGVLTDGRLYYGEHGEVFKIFHTLDGHGIKRLRATGVEVAVISGRRSAMVERRMGELGVTRVYQGIDDKLPVFRGLLAELGLEAGETACMGDDEPDLPMLREAGLAAAPANAAAIVLPHVHWQASMPGGSGAVRELCDLLLAARNNPDTATP
ncbi:MAG: HAD hydrolase family protein [Gammaproteobacteria bacterium]|jgi:3-deoxy-D-manno-octulosonate 8-phosphate phosphatase (KDO 8-P phosphatase)